MSLFQTINSKFIVNLLSNTLDQVIYVAPGVSVEIAKMLLKISHTIPKNNIRIIIDSDPQICRLGYGDIGAIELLIKEGISINKVKSLRIGVLIVDGNAWLYSPVPLVIEDENEININAISVTVDQAMELTEEICGGHSRKSIQTTIFDVDGSFANEEEQTFKPEEYQKHDLEMAKKDLEVRPPKKFDLQRQVQVYTGYFQFVELSLVGIGLRRMTISIPSNLLAVSSNKEVQEKLKATYKLFNENSKISGKVIEDKVAYLRKTYTRSMGKRLGSVILLRNKEVFIKGVNNIREEIIKFSTKIKKSLEKELAYTKKEISKILVPIIMKNPPDDLKGIIPTQKPSKEVALQYIDDVLSKALPEANDLITEMELQCDFKDITYEMLNDPIFQKNIKKQFKFANFDKPYESYGAVKLK